MMRGLFLVIVLLAGCAVDEQARYHAFVEKWRCMGYDVGFTCTENRWGW